MDTTQSLALDSEEAILMNPNVDPKPLLERRKKQPFLAGLLSLMPGLGQVYVGYYRRGFTNLLVVAGTITIIASGQANKLQPLFGLFLAFFWLYNIIDAVRLANLYNDALAGFGPDDLRHELVMLGRRGSIIGGSFLVLGSLLGLLHTVFGMPLDWLQQWWPIFPLAFGAYLLLQGVRERNR